MTSKFASTEKVSRVLSNQSRPAREDGSRERRRLEMKRRYVGLQSRRNHLERELEAVKNCLFSLHRQMQNHAAYEQLSINK